MKDKMKDQYKKLYSYTVPLYSQLIGDKLVSLAKDSPASRRTKNKAKAQVRSVAVSIKYYIEKWKIIKSDLIIIIFTYYKLLKIVL